MLITRFLTLLTFAVMFCFFGNVTFPDIPTPTENTVFTELREKYQNPILDADFKTLKEITASKTYLDFLKQEYPTGKPFKTLEEFIKVAPPTVERYRDYLKEIFKKPTDEDLMGIHQLTIVYRHGNAMMTEAMETQNVKDMHAAIQKKAQAITKEPIKTWWRSRFSEAGMAQFTAFFTKFEKFVLETEQADTLWIREQIEKHGQGAGILWVAIRKPVLIGEIINNFPNMESFLSWVEKQFEPHKM